MWQAAAMACLVRPATALDAALAVAVIRASITELCVLDHQRDPATLKQWLENKTTERFLEWLEDRENYVVVAVASEADSAVIGVGLSHVSGHIRLCYVQPGWQRSGVGAALLRALEAHAFAQGLRELRLLSSTSARPFYEQQGYRSTGGALPGFGLTRAFPYAKALS
jgi:GNAT superfamily N-acetyltransferase